MINKDEILGIAALTRKACEEWNKQFEQFSSCLCGMCCMASHFLWRKLKEAGYMPRFHLAETGPKYYWGCHCWVSVGRMHVDITGTQFAPVNPVYTYTGTKGDHPLLKAHFGPRKDLAFPDSFMLYSGNSEDKIAEIIDGWEDEYTLKSDMGHQLEDFYERALCLT